MNIHAAQARENFEIYRKHQVYLSSSPGSMSLHTFRLVPQRRLLGFINIRQTSRRYIQVMKKVNIHVEYVHKKGMN